MRDAGDAHAVHWWEVAVCAAASLVGALPAALSPPHRVYDSYSYLSSPSLHSLRLPVVPVLYELLGHNLRAIVVVQALIGALCWSALALEALRSQPRPWGYLPFAAVLLVACSDYVSQWYAALLSDSLSLSLFALMLAVALRWLGGRGSLVWVLVVSWAWAFTRNTNGYLLVVVGVVGLVALAVPAWRSRRAVMSYGLSLLVGVGVVVASDTGSLYKQPIEHVMVSRVLPSSQRTAWFVRHGMPISPEIRQVAASDSLLSTFAAQTTFEHSPALAAYRAWVYHSGERVYLEYAASHPAWVISGALSNDHELTPDTLGYYSGAVDRPWYPAPLAGVLLDDRRQTLAVLGAAAVVLLAAVGVRRRAAFRDRQVRWWLAVVTTGMVTLIGDWIGDSFEVGRHYVGATVQITVGLSFVLALGAAALSRPRTRSPQSDPSPTVAAHDGRPRQLDNAPS